MIHRFYDAKNDIAFRRLFAREAWRLPRKQKQIGNSLNTSKAYQNIIVNKTG